MGRNTYRQPTSGPCPSCGGARGRNVKRTDGKGRSVDVWVPCNGCGGSGKVFA